MVRRHSLKTRSRRRAQLVESSSAATLSYRRSYISIYLYYLVEEATTEGERGRRESPSSGCSRPPVAVVSE